MTIRFTSALALVVVLLATILARAQDENEGERRERALALLKEGRARYDLGKFDEAIVLFEKSYEVWPYPEALYNLGQSWRKKSEPAKAIHFYRAYLRNKSDAPNRAEVEQRIAEMEDLVAAQQATAEKPPEGTQEPVAIAPDVDEPRSDPVPERTPIAPPVVDATEIEADRWYTDRWGWAITGGGVVTDRWGWAITGGGVVTAGVAVGFLVSASGLDAAADDEMDQAERVDLRERAHSRRTLGAILAIGGGAVTVAGIAKLLWTGDSPRESRVADLVVGPNYLGLVGAF